MLISGLSSSFKTQPRFGMNSPSPKKNHPAIPSDTDTTSSSGQAQSVPGSPAASVNQAQNQQPIPGSPAPVEQEQPQDQAPEEPQSPAHVGIALQNDDSPVTPPNQGIAFNANLLHAPQVQRVLNFYPYSPGTPEDPRLSKRRRDEEDPV